MRCVRTEQQCWLYFAYKRELGYLEMLIDMRSVSTTAMDNQSYADVSSDNRQSRTEMAILFLINFNNWKIMHKRESRIMLLLLCQITNVTRFSTEI
uniref:Uncharacterized protein n=1 Tax=Arion vulgaris TaxID=1028688 RepID=A0A0B7A8H1_9EUPU